MSDEQQDDIEKAIGDTGAMPIEVTRALRTNPVEREKMGRMVRIERENRKQSVALFGHTELKIPGLVSDMVDVRDRFSKVEGRIGKIELAIQKGIWTIAGGAALGGFLIGIAGLVIELTKH